MIEGQSFNQSGRQKPNPCTFEIKSVFEFHFSKSNEMVGRPSLHSWT